MTKIRTYKECYELAEKRKEHEISLRSTQFNLAVDKVVELVRDTFIGYSCQVPLTFIISPTHDTYATFIERDPEVVKAAIEILRNEFVEAGWNVYINSKILFWPFTSKIYINLAYTQHYNYNP